MRTTHATGTHIAMAASIFLSYAWGPTDATGSRPLQVKAQGIVAALRRAGYSVWLDTERMSGAATGGAGLSDAMAAGVSAASAVVVCFSDAYARSVNCKRELGFADELRKRIFYVNVGDAGYTAKSYLSSPEPDHSLGWLVFRMQDALWADCRTPGAGGLELLLSSLEAAGVPRGTGSSSGPGKADDPSCSHDVREKVPAAASAPPATPPALSHGAPSAYDALLSSDVGGDSDPAPLPVKAVPDAPAPSLAAALNPYEDLPPVPAPPPAAAARPALPADAFVVPSLDRAGAEALLKPHAARGTAGAFLIRGSRDGPGSFAISMTSRGGGAAGAAAVRHSLVQAAPGRPGAVVVSQQQAPGAEAAGPGAGAAAAPREFPSLAALLRAFASLELAVDCRAGPSLGALLPREEAIKALDADARYGEPQAAEARETCAASAGGAGQQSGYDGLA